MYLVLHCFLSSSLPSLLYLFSIQALVSLTTTTITHLSSPPPPPSSLISPHHHHHHHHSTSISYLSRFKHSQPPTVFATKYQWPTKVFIAKCQLPTKVFTTKRQLPTKVSTRHSPSILSFSLLSRGLSLAKNKWTILASKIGLRFYILNYCFRFWNLNVLSDLKVIFLRGFSMIYPGIF